MFTLNLEMNFPVTEERLPIVDLRVMEDVLHHKMDMNGVFQWIYEEVVSPIDYVTPIW